MQEFVVAPLVTPHTEGSLAMLPRRHAAENPDGIAFSRHEGGEWTDVTYARFLAEVRGVAKGLLAAGIEVGDRVGLMCATRYEWTLLDFAIWTAGAVPVPVYDTSSAEQLAWILSDSRAKALFVETPEHMSAARTVRADLEHLAHVWQIEGGGLDELVAAGADVDDAALDAHTVAVGPGDLATIIYTSGTTGRPKGCELTHGNFLDLSANAVQALPEILREPGASLLLFLPLAHVLARLVEVLAFDGGVRIGHSPDVSRLLPDLASFRPTFLLAVPRVFEKIYNATDQKLATEGKGRVFRLAAKTAIAYSRALDESGPSLGLRLQHRVFDALVYRKLREAMGGRVGYAVSGGAPLGPRLGHFFRGIGLVILEGYGLTETTAPTNVGTPSMLKIGTVGRPLPGVGVRVDDSGEVLVNGVGVFRGYHNDPEGTRAVFTDDGWLRTGDLGELDDGFLRITGRQKEILVTAGGKNVSPAQLEDVVRAHPLVSQCLVVGDGRPFVAALITIDGEMVGVWGKAHGMPDLTVEAALTNEDVRHRLQAAIDRANETVSRAESIRAFEILEGDFTEHNGYLTPSLKLKRNRIAADFAGQIDALYEQASAARQKAPPAEGGPRGH